MMRITKYFLQMLCFAGLTTACIDHSNRGLPDATVEYDADTTDADVNVIATASVTFAGSIQAEASFSATSAEVSGVVKVTLAPENPDMRGVRIMTGSSCDAGSEGTVWGSGDLGDMEIVGAAHVGTGELAVGPRSDWTIGASAASDIDGHVLVIYNGAGDTGTIDACGLIVQD